MKIYRISQDVNTGYDTYSDAVVIAKTVEDAKGMHPSARETLFPDIFYDEEKGMFMNKYHGSDETCVFEDEYGGWTNDLTAITVEELGTAKKGSVEGVVCASFHAG